MQIVPMKGKVAKIAKAVVATNHSLYCKMSKGNLIVAKGYFYRNGYTHNQLAEDITKLFNKYNININIIESGDIWKPFKGGASIWQQSRFWVELNVNSVENAKLDGLEL